ncbi:MAG: sugar phosphate nucleotidyltransferase [Bacteroidota bacterium]
MKIIIPMAGMGKRMRPHTLTTPKPLIKIAGKAIVNHLVYEIQDVLNEKIEEINFVIGDFGDHIENELQDLAHELGAKPVISYQEKPLGTAHAVYCARSSLRDKVIVAFSDTLFKADFKLNTESDGIIWTKKVEDPSAFGVVRKDGNGYVDGFYEKPEEYVSDEAIIGVYYFRKGEELKKEIEYLLENELMGNGEYQLTDALENLRNKGNFFTTSVVNQWYDCGNKIATVATNREILKYYSHKELIDESAKIENSVVVEPCYIGKNAKLKNSVVGPYVSVENNTCIKNSLISNSLIQSDTHLERVNIVNSMIGNNINMEGKPSDLSVGDFTNIKL